jgi:hypothetical protein
MFDIQKELIDEAEKRDGRLYNWDNVSLVLGFLKYQGTEYAFLTDEQYTQAYLLCNGLGEMDLESAKVLNFDWSHVRNSSPIGFDRAAEYLKTLRL